MNPQNLKIATGKQLTGAALDRFKAERAMIDAMRLAPEEREAPRAVSASPARRAATSRDW